MIKQVMKFIKSIALFLFLMAVLKIQAQVDLRVSNESDFNTSFQEYSPAFYNGGLVFITSNPAVAKVKASDDNTGKATTSIFFAKRLESGLLAKPTAFAESLTTSFYDGPLCFSADGLTIYFTRSNLKRNRPITAKDGLVKLKIYSARLIGDKWGNIAELPFNNDNYDCSHPSVSPDGRRLYFASNRSGGFGGMDLYVSTLIDGKWSDPVNLGPKVNTRKNEVFPFIHANGKVFFASNGRKDNRGGLDIYFTEKTDTGWLSPRTLPEPINSRSDDFGLVVSPDKMSGYFSSNRSSGKGDDDIFAFQSAQSIDAEFIIDEEITNKSITEENESVETTELVASLETKMGDTEKLNGAVKLIEKTNNSVSPKSADTDSAPVKDTISDVQIQVDAVKSDLVKLENPIIESAKVEVSDPEISMVQDIVKSPNQNTEIKPANPIESVTTKTEEVKIEAVVVTEKPAETIVSDNKPLNPTIAPLDLTEAKIEEKAKTDMVKVEAKTAVEPLKMDKHSVQSGKYLVVVGTYADEKNAKIQQKIVINKGYPEAEVIHYRDKNLFGVYVKRSNDEKEASMMARNVVKSGMDAFVKVLK